MSYTHYVGVFLVSTISLWLMLRSSVIVVADIPNQRSLHQKVTPRAGGIAIVLGVLFGVLAAVSMDALSDRSVIVLSGLFITLSALGYLDDRRSLSIRIRLVVQIVVAVICWRWVIAMPETGWLWFVPGVLVLIWGINLTNFMDGMDGLVASQAILGLACLSVWVSNSGHSELPIVCLVVAVATAGFLVFNWPAARVFMGDAGSLALGLMMAAVSLYGITRYDIPVTACLILFAPFLADSGITLLRRMISGEKWWEAHRSHFYQRAVGAGWSQLEVLKRYLLLQLVMIGLATRVFINPEGAWWPLTITIVILTLVAWRIHGREQTN